MRMEPSTATGGWRNFRYNSPGFAGSKASRKLDDTAGPRLGSPVRDVGLKWRSNATTSCKSIDKYPWTKGVARKRDALFRWIRWAAFSSIAKSAKDQLGQ